MKHLYTPPWNKEATFFSPLIASITRPIINAVLKDAVPITLDTERIWETLPALSSVVATETAVISIGL